jgi:hypothetical protein
MVAEGPCGHSRGTDLAPILKSTPVQHHMAHLVAWGPAAESPGYHHTLGVGRSSRFEQVSSLTDSLQCGAHDPGRAWPSHHIPWAECITGR